MIEAHSPALMNERLKNGRSEALKNVNCLSEASFYILA